MSKVCVFIAEGFEEVEGLTVVDLLRRAEITVDMVSITGNKVVTGSNGITVTCEKLSSEADYAEYDMAVLPGGMPGTLNLKADETVRKVAADFAADENKWMCAICAAPTVLADVGLLEGKQATCYPAMEPNMMGAVLTQGKVAEDGNLITSQGIGTAIEFSLTLIEKLKDKQTADEIATGIVYR